MKEGFRERGRIFNVNFTLLLGRDSDELVHEVIPRRRLLIIGSGCLEEFVDDHHENDAKAAADGVDVGNFHVDPVDPERRQDGFAQFDEANLSRRRVLRSDRVGDVDGADDKTVKDRWEDREGRQDDGRAGRIGDLWCEIYGEIRKPENKKSKNFFLGINLISTPSATGRMRIAAPRWPKAARRGMLSSESFLDA